MVCGPVPVTSRYAQSLDDVGDGEGVVTETLGDGDGDGDGDGEAAAVARLTVQPAVEATMSAAIARYRATRTASAWGRTVMGTPLFVGPGVLTLYPRRLRAQGSVREAIV
jgi:sirohydrochlorin ferrochelatase